MQILPIEYFVANVVRYNDALQWIEFRGGRHWLRMSKKSCCFSIGMASEDFDLRVDDIEFRDKSGSSLDAKVKKLEGAPKGFSDFAFLPSSKKALLNIELPLNDNSHQTYPISIYMPLKSNKAELIFTIRPELIYPDFLFEAVHNYGPSLANTFQNFVETGSLYGHTSIHASYYFENVHTIELSEHLYDSLKPVETARPNLFVHHGNSKDILPKILGKLPGATVFFLDAHWSGDDSVDWSKGKFSGYPTSTAHSGLTTHPKPDEQKPIKTEFELIFKTYSGPALLIIDDWDIIGETDAVFDKFNWSHLSKSDLVEYFSNSNRTIFQHRLGESRYVVGLKELS